MTSTTRAELERRWTAVRAAMEEHGIDVLIAQNNSEEMGGYVRYLTDVAASAYPTAVVFPRDDEMTVVGHGPVGGDMALVGDPRRRGVRRLLTEPGFVTANYCRHYDADNVARALAPYARGTIGLVGTMQMGHAFAERVRERCPGARFVDASDAVDRVKAIKSEAEKELIRQTALLQEQVMAAAIAAVQPGRKEREVTAAAWAAAYALGSESGVVGIGSAPAGTPATPRPLPDQDRAIAEGDSIFVLIEVNGPGGMFTELGRMVVVGPVPAAMEEELGLALEARRRTLALLVPGARPAEVWEAYNAFLRERGRPEERRIHAHGQGCDMVERPLIRFDEPMPVAANMNIACHPAYPSPAGFSTWVCDGYLIGPEGPPERLHHLPETIVSV